MVKKSTSKKEMLEKIESFFERKDLDAGDVKKVKRLAMKYKIRLGDYRKRFCGACYADLKCGKVRVTKNSKSVECPNCKKINRWKIR